VSRHAPARRDRRQVGSQPPAAHPPRPGTPPRRLNSHPSQPPQRR